ncbi:MAG: 3-deoxy-D-manno-octulosonic acid transferase [Deltaproteobacteria bacterium]|nr:3-deoxy-D-manno-octulosonic acid transferase [Deltaproteobacteria bacterium]
MFYAIYGALTTSLFLLLFPFVFLYIAVTHRFQKHFQERLGFLPAKAVKSLSGSPRIWIHGASLGEIRVAATIIKSLKAKLPGCAVIVSTMTEHGRSLALEIFEKDVPVVYAPIDLPGCAIKALALVRPDVMIFLETEIWPTWIFTARKLGIKLALLNGRISPRSLKGYLKFRPFFRSVLKNFDVFSMISENDADRIHAMGALSGKIRVSGNAKYDSAVTSPDPAVEQQMRQMLNLSPLDRIIVAGSTRGGEEEMLLDAYAKIHAKSPDTLLILAPRHIKRASDICALIRSRGFECQLRTEIDQGKIERTARILIIDTFGELFNIYSIATCVFCGASLVPLGGQNPLEPAVWGKPILYGPHMEDFQDAKDLLESGGGSIEVSDPGELAETFLNLLKNPQKAGDLGNRAREAAFQTRVAAHRHADVIKILCSK